MPASTLSVIKAIADLKQALRLGANDLNAHFDLASIYSRKRDYDQAISHYSEAIRLKPKDGILNLASGMLYYFRAGAYLQTDARLGRGTQPPGSFPQSPFS